MVNVICEVVLAQAHNIQFVNFPGSEIIYRMNNNNNILDLFCVVS